MLCEANNIPVLALHRCNDAGIEGLETGGGVLGQELELYVAQVHLWMSRTIVHEDKNFPLLMNELACFLAHVVNTA